MPNKSTKQIIKPLYHILAVGLLTAVFIALNVAGVITQDSEPPKGMIKSLEFILSTKYIYVLMFGFLLIVAMAVRLREYRSLSPALRKISFWILSAITGKLYTLGALFLSLAILPLTVDYIKPFPNAFAIGMGSVVVGWAFWYMARTFATWVWRRAS